MRSSHSRPPLPSPAAIAPARRRSGRRPHQRTRSSTSSFCCRRIAVSTIFSPDFPGPTPFSKARACRLSGARLEPQSSKPVTLETDRTLGLGTDIDHSHHAFELEYDHGKMDGFNKIGFGAAGYGAPAKLYPYAYVKRSEVQAYWDFAKQYALADKMFFTDTASSFIAHQLIISGTVRLNDHESLTDQPNQDPWGCDAPPGTVTAVIYTNGKVNEFGGPFPCFHQYGTIADLLDANGVSWKYLRLEHHEGASGVLGLRLERLRRDQENPLRSRLEEQHQLAQYEPFSATSRTAACRRSRGSFRRSRPRTIRPAAAITGRAGSLRCSTQSAAASTGRTPPLFWLGTTGAVGTTTPSRRKSTTRASDSAYR